MSTSVDVTVPILGGGRSKRTLAAGRTSLAPQLVLVLNYLLVFDKAWFGMEYLLASVAVVDVLGDGTARLGSASDSTCETTLSPQGSLWTLRPGRERAADRR